MLQVSNHLRLIRATADHRQCLRRYLGPYIFSKLLAYPELIPTKLPKRSFTASELTSLRPSINLHDHSPRACECDISPLDLVNETPEC